MLHKAENTNEIIKWDTIITAVVIMLVPGLKAKIYILT